MKKLFRAAFFLGLFGMFLWSVESVRAATLALTKISGTSVVGLDYSLVSYTGPLPVFEGMATPGATVVITINSIATSSAVATASGAWRFVPISLNAGSNGILLVSGPERIAFTLMYTAEVVTPTSTTTPTPTPAVIAEEVLLETGTAETTMFIVGAGILIMVVAWGAKKYFHYWEKH